MSRTEIYELSPTGGLLRFTPEGLAAALPWLAAGDVPRLMRAFEDAGHQILGVGGCVRNAVLGLGPTDIDLSTDAKPEKATRIAEGQGFKVIPTGVDHGTITVVTDQGPVEITTFRKDVETDGRRAVVAFSGEVADDAMRRDFTMNALYVRASGQIVDPLGGSADMLARRVRFIGAPEDRIREDYLRILRFFRFFAQIGSWQDGIDAEGLAACAALSDGLRQISNERIGAEMRKLLMAPNAPAALGAMEQSGVLRSVLPGADAATFARLAQDDAAEALLETRLAALWTAEIVDQLRLSKAEARGAKALRDAALSDAGPAELGYRLGAVNGAEAVRLRSALMSLPVDPAALKAAAEGAVKVFPVSASDLEGLQGKAIGDRLKLLERHWIDSGFALSKESLLSA